VIPFRSSGGGLDIPVKAVPRSSRDRVAGEIGGRLKVCVAAAPEKGRANERVAETVASFFGVAPSMARVVAGASTPFKTVRVTGLSEDEARARIEAGTAK